MRATISLALNGTAVTVSGIEPTTTLLQWLRRERRLTGTKEGCAEGDCGACTVVVGTLVDGDVAYRSVNACIAPLALFEGRAVHTVENLAGPNGALHPCQQAMVDCHASQCGFCTPGFVMSLYALYMSQQSRPDRATVDRWLAGNLCRCTGYGPIASAAEQMFDRPRPEQDRHRVEADRALLAAMRHTETLEIVGATARLFAPATLDALSDVYARHPTATLVSGATDVGLWITKQGRDLPLLVTTNRIEDAPFASVRIDGRTCWIGAGVTHETAAAAVPSPALAELWRRFAGLQVRNAGTVGGNIANGSPIGDLAPALIALGATLHLRRGTTKRTCALEDYFIAYGRQDRAPGELVLGVAFDLPADARDFAVHKVTKRFDDDISAVCGAFHIALDDTGHVATARIAYGGMATTPKRARAAEATLLGAPWNRAAVDAACAALARDFSPISDMRASAAYRRDVAANLLLRTWMERERPDTPLSLAAPERPGSGAVDPAAGPHGR